MTSIVKLGALILSLAVAGCDETVFVNLNYASTNQGIINSGLIQTGSIYYINLDAGGGRFVENVNFPNPDAFPLNKNQPVDIDVSGIQGLTVSVSGFQTQGVNTNAVTLDIGRRSTVKITKGAVGRMNVAAIVDRFKKLTDNEKIAWGLEDAAQSPTGIYVLVYGEIRVEKAEYYLGDRNDKDGSGITANIGSIQAKLVAANNSTFTWTGPGTPVIVNLSPFQVRKSRTGEYTIQPANSDIINKMNKRITEIFRSTPML